MKKLKPASFLSASILFITLFIVALARADSPIVAPTIKVTPYYFYIGDVRTEELIALSGVAESMRDVNWVVEASECVAKERVSRATSFAKKRAGKYKSVSIIKTRFECF